MEAPLVAASFQLAIGDAHPGREVDVRLGGRLEEETPMKRLDEICREFDLLSVYLFGSRADEGLQLLQGEPASAEGSDLDVGVFFVSRDPDVHRLGELQIALEEVFDPFRVDLVPLDRVDPLFQFRAIDGHRIATSDSTATDERELEVMRRAADLLPFQRQAEIDTFGVATS
jgi:predicted nucleotidyltransferase